MRRGFVFGKYLPFHLGHKALIEFALTKCDQLYVLVCATNTEVTSVETRVGWLQETFQEVRNVTVLTLKYDETILPNTSVSSKEASKRWSKEFLSRLPQVHMVCTSEPYGDYVGEFMGIEHVLFDRDRIQVPVSSSMIRTSYYAYWSFLPVAVKRSYQKKIVLLGTESTGKSSIAESISQSLDSTLVDETGRQLIPNSNSFTKDDLRKVAFHHASRIRSACDNLSPLVLIDTDVHITQSYAKYRFGEYLDLPYDIYQANRAHLYFYLDATLDLSQDGTRLDQAERLHLDAIHRMTLRHFGIKFSEVGGSWKSRLHHIVNEIQSLRTQPCL